MRTTEHPCYKESYFWLGNDNFHHNDCSSEAEVYIWKGDNFGNVDFCCKIISLWHQWILEIIENYQCEK